MGVEHRGQWTGKRKQLPDEETGRQAWWTVELGRGMYWSVTFDKTTAVYTARRYEPAVDGDGELMLEDLKGDNAKGVADTYGLFWTK